MSRRMRFNAPKGTSVGGAGNASRKAVAERSWGAERNEVLSGQESALFLGKEDGGKK